MRVSLLPTIGGHTIIHMSSPATADRIALSPSSETSRILPAQRNTSVATLFCHMASSLSLSHRHHCLTLADVRVVQTTQAQQLLCRLLFLTSAVRNMRTNCFPPRVPCCQIQLSSPYAYFTAIRPCSAVCFPATPRSLLTKLRPQPFAALLRPMRRTSAR